MLADCYRALHRWTAVAELWDELREASPDPAVVADGRIVMAGALADQGKLTRRSRCSSESGDAARARPQLHHLKQWYALADLYDRAGDVPRARTLFTRVRQADPTFADVRAAAASPRLNVTPSLVGSRRLPFDRNRKVIRRGSPMNIVLLHGVLTREPDLRELPSGDHVASFDLTVRDDGYETEVVPVAWHERPARRRSTSSSPAAR